MNDDVYDIDSIHDNGIRIQYQTLRKRFFSVAQQVQNAYILDGKKIEFRFVVDGHFNASVQLVEDKYLVRMSNVAPVLLMIFFDKLYSSSSTLPWLSHDDSDEVDYEIPFSVDARNLSNRENWRVRTNKIRAFAAHTLADISTSFIFFHELGHILGGHLKELEHSGNHAFHSEFRSFNDPIAEDCGMDQLREYQADAVAASMTTRIIEELVDNVLVNKRTASVFGSTDHILENTISLTISALYGLFAYLRGQEKSLQLFASHPDPIIRAFYCRDIIFQEIMNKHDIDLEIAESLLQNRFDEINVVLEKLNLVTPNAVDAEWLTRAVEESDKLRDLQADRGGEITRFAYISWNS